MARTTDRVLEFIRRYRAEHGYSPTIREIAEGTEGISTTSVVEYHLGKLEAAGRICRVPGRSRTVVIRE